MGAKPQSLIGRLQMLGSFNAFLIFDPETGERVLSHSCAMSEAGHIMSGALSNAESQAIDALKAHALDAIKTWLMAAHDPDSLSKP